MSKFNNAIHTFWYNPNGNALPDMDYACIASWMHQGKTVVFWTYGEIISDDLLALRDKFPQFHIREASELVHKSEYFVADYSHVNLHGFAMFSDWFRYEILQKFGGWWLDTDVVLLNDVYTLSDLEDPTAEVPMIWDERFSTNENRLMSNNAVIYCQKPDMMSEAITRCKKAIEDTIVACEKGYSHSIKWGNTGPLMVTNMRDAGLALSNPQKDFYLIDFYQYTGSLARYCYNPTNGNDIVKFLHRKPVGIHLWNSYIKQHGKIAEYSLFDICLKLAKDFKQISATTIIQELADVEQFPNILHKNHK